MADIYSAALCAYESNDKLALPEARKARLALARDEFVECDRFRKMVLDALQSFLRILERRWDEHCAALSKLSGALPLDAIRGELLQSQEMTKELEKAMTSFSREEQPLIGFLGKSASTAHEVNATMLLYVWKQQVETEKLRYVTDEMPLYAFLVAAGTAFAALSARAFENELQIEHIRTTVSDKIGEFRRAMVRSGGWAQRVRDLVISILETPLDLVSLLTAFLELQRQFSNGDFTNPDGCASICL